MFVSKGINIKKCLHKFPVAVKTLTCILLKVLFHVPFSLPLLEMGVKVVEKKVLRVALVGFEAQSCDTVC